MNAKHLFICYKVTAQIIKRKREEKYFESNSKKYHKSIKEKEKL